MKKKERGIFMTVYVNAKEKKIISEKEYEFLLTKAIREADNPHNFFFWLEKNYDIEEIWGLTGQEKCLVKQEFLEFLEITYEESFAKGWVPMEYDAMEEDS